MIGHRTFILAGALSAIMTAAAAAAEPETVFFKSADDRTEIVGYLFKPQTAGPHSAIVLLHGRGGPYSINHNKDCTFVSRSVASACNAGTLSMRHRMWGEYWAERGYLALLPDSFGPRGKAHGFGRFTHDDPERDDVNEKTVRPLDAEGALAFLCSRDDVVANRIFLQGWSNGGSTTLNVMIRQGARTAGFRAALAFYPGCGSKALLAPVVSTTAPVAMFLGSDDEEVSPRSASTSPSARAPPARTSTSRSILARRMISTIPAASGNRCRETRRRSRMRCSGRSRWWRG
jgi:dienelactone hydrolase